MPASLHFAPSGSLSTIDEYGLVHTLRPLPKMSRRMGEVADVGWNEPGHDGMTLTPGNYRARQYYNPLLGKTFPFLKAVHVSHRDYTINLPISSGSEYRPYE
jgi:hypothetical protein